MQDADDLDGCDLDFNASDIRTEDADIDALVLFAGVQWDDPAAVERHRQQLIEWSAG